jgi:hypothetical protein
MGLNRRIAVALACSVTAAGAFAGSAAAAVQSAPVAHPDASSLRAPAAAPARVARLLKLRGAGHRALARASYLDPTGMVDTTAYCNSSGGLQQMNPDGSISTAPTTWHATTGEPSRVLPTINGYQAVAVRLNVVGSNGSYLARGHWFFASVDSVGYFREFWSGSMRYSFVDATTGQLWSHLEANSTPASGTGVRFTVDVAWYVNNAVARMQSVAVPYPSNDFLSSKPLYGYCFN